MYIAFDLDDTLYVRVEPFEKTCREILEDKIKLDWNEVFKTRNIYGDDLFMRQFAENISDEDMYIERMRLTMKHYGYDMKLDEILRFEERFKYHQSHITLRPGMDALLDMLQDFEIPLGIMTNGASKRQRPKLYALNIPKWIPEEMWCISGEVGAIKPDPVIFKAMEEMFGASEASDCWLIGDNPEMDIRGADAAGWNAILFDNSSENPVGLVSEKIQMLLKNK